MTRRRIKTSSRWAGITGVAVLVLVATACGGGDDTRTVRAVDYRFENLPNSVKAGTKLQLSNASPAEVHEMVVVRLPDGERRSPDELINLPESELWAVVAGEPAAVLFRPPGRADQINAVGDGRLTQKGRYLVFCAIPIGADPAAFVQAVQNAADGPPQLASGPPHFTQGMYGEITVK